ncbi:MAG: NifB/NifX family molybdenum-iron cluster-binding protein [Pirellulales bacterium]|nr:NifB/NifX family molybdenum-iron cluster-binding protein [Pirellulales bacterium]
MRIAIPSFGTRVSPRFDCAGTILVVEIADSQAAEGPSQTRREEKAVNWDAAERVERLIAWDVDVVLCGGIDCWSVEALQSAGITVYGWVAGEIEEALSAFLRGEFDLQPESPDRGWCRCRRFAGGEGPPGPGRGRGRRGGQGRGGQGRGGRGQGGRGPSQL